MPQIVDAMTVVVTEQEVAALVRERIAASLNVPVDALPVLSINTQHHITIMKEGVEIAANEIDVAVRNFVVVLGKPAAPAEGAANEG